MNPYRVTEATQLLAQWLEHPHLAARFPLYTGYLESLANAERLNAVHKYLRPLIKELELVSLGERFELVDAQCRAVSWSGRSGGSIPVTALPHEYLKAIAIPTLLERRSEAPSDHRPFLWLALLPGWRYSVDLPESRELLQEALRLAPHDSFIVERLIDERLRSIGFDCHHLPETLLGPVVAVRKEIAEARALIALLPEAQRTVPESITLSYEGLVDSFVLAKGGVSAV